MFDLSRLLESWKGTAQQSADPEERLSDEERLLVLMAAVSPDRWV